MTPLDIDPVADRSDDEDGTDHPAGGSVTRSGGSGGPLRFELDAEVFEILSWRTTPSREYESLYSWLRGDQSEE